jgi:rhodanese-related sulfurtransferase
MEILGGLSGVAMQYRTSLIVASLCALGMLIPACWNSGKEPAMRVINVLSNELYKDAHITGSVHVPFENVEQQAAKWNKKIPVVVYCSNYACSASSSATRALIRMGFHDVHAYEGGMAEWYQLGYPTMGKVEQAYLQHKMEKPDQHDEHEIDAVQLREQMKTAGLIE